MRGLLPESVRTRRDKSGFEPAIADALGPFETVSELMRFERLDQLGFLDRARFLDYIAPLRDAPRIAANGLLWVDVWTALAAEAFLRQQS